MDNPLIGGINASTGESWQRQMTDEEYEELLSSGWVLEPIEENKE